MPPDETGTDNLQSGEPSLGIPDETYACKYGRIAAIPLKTRVPIWHDVPERNTGVHFERPVFSPLYSVYLCAWVRGLQQGRVIFFPEAASEFLPEGQI